MLSVCLSHPHIALGFSSMYAEVVCFLCYYTPYAYSCFRLHLLISMFTQDRIEMFIITKTSIAVGYKKYMLVQILPSVQLRKKH